MPPLFARWLSPWYLTTSDSGFDEWTVWAREYQEESHCGTPGCCEMRSLTLGPILERHWHSDPNPMPFIHLWPTKRRRGSTTIDGVQAGQ